MKNKFKDFLFEIIYLIVIAVLFVLFYMNIINIDTESLVAKTFASFYNSERINLITVFLSILSGIYLTVITIIGTSRLCLSSELLSKKLDKRLINYFLMGLIEDIIGVVLCIITDSESCIIIYIITSITLMLTVVSFLRFVFILKNLLISNLEAMVKNIDDENREKRIFKETIRRIEENTRRKHRKKTQEE